MTRAIKQQGSLLITAIILVVIASFLGLTVTSLFVSSVTSSTAQGSADTALFLADSGLEKGIRGWALDSGYTGEGPVSFGQGNFTITTSDDDINGNPLPADQKRITSTGTVNTALGTASRTLNVIASFAIQTLFYEPFPDINNWPGSGATPDSFCPAGSGGTLVQDTEGTVSYDSTEDAGSASGSIKAQVTDGHSGERLAGYREYTFSSVIPANTQLSVDFWYHKYKGNPSADVINMAFDLVATDGTLYRLWSDCATSGNMNWAAVPTIDWIVPNGVEIDRIRLAYEIQNQVSTKGKNNGTGAAVWFDEINIDSTGGLIW